MATWQRCGQSTWYRYEQPGGKHPKLVYVDPVDFISVNIARHVELPKMWVDVRFLNTMDPYDLVTDFNRRDDAFRRWVGRVYGMAQEGPLEWKDLVVDSLDREDEFWRKTYLWSVAHALSYTGNVHSTRRQVEVQSQEDIFRALKEFKVPEDCLPEFVRVG